MPLTQWTLPGPPSSGEALEAASLDRHAVSNALGVVRLPRARISAEDSAALAGLIGALERTRMSALRRAEQLAHWVNVYWPKTAGYVIVVIGVT